MFRMRFERLPGVLQAFGDAHARDFIDRLVVSRPGHFEIITDEWIAQGPDPPQQRSGGQSDAHTILVGCIAQARFHWLWHIFSPDSLPARCARSLYIWLHRVVKRKGRATRSNE